MSMTQISPIAMVLAAGFGMRMRPLTLTTPKPLLEVGGKPMIDYALDRLAAAGVTKAVVNAFYLPEQIKAHVQKRLARGAAPDLVVSHEDELLETGGGIVRALPHFDGKPFYALNSDLPWTEGATPALRRLAEFWDGARMDALLLLMPTEKALGFGRDGKAAPGDFFRAEDGRLSRAGTQPPRPLVYLGAQIIKPAVFARPPAAVFSTNVIWDRIEAQGRLYGLIHDGTCYHVGTPKDLADANERLASGRGWRA